MVNAFSLHDIRQISSSPETELRKAPLTRYVSSLSKRRVSWLARPEATSLCFTPEGDMFCALLSRYHPTLYSLSDEAPLTTLYADDYSNACTIKHGTFGRNHLNGQLRFSAGSDDCTIRSWDISASVQTLQEQREIVGKEKWFHSEDTQGCSDVHFAKSMAADRIIPSKVPQPAVELKGHRSIVNVRDLVCKASERSNSVLCSQSCTILRCLLVCSLPLSLC